MRNNAFRGAVWAWFFSALIVSAMVGALFCVSKLATAGAVPGEKMDVDQVATHVCADLRENPSVSNLLDIVQALYEAGNTEEQENNVMYRAMNVICPEYRPIALAAVEISSSCKCGPLYEQYTKPAKITGGLGGKLGA